MKYKELKKLLKKTQLELFRVQGRLAIATKLADDMLEFSNQQERHMRIAENSLEREWVIVSYLEDRQMKLIQAMAE